MIEYYIDGSTKGKFIGVGLVKINEFGFVEKRDFNIEHINPSSQIAEGYSLEKALEMIVETDMHKNEIINIYTDCQQLHYSLLFNEDIEFSKNNFFIRQESNDYFRKLRELYVNIISRHSKSSIYHCVKTNGARPLVKLFYKDTVEDKQYLQEAHTLSRKYIKKEEAKPISIELKAVKKENIWYIIKNNKEVIAENKRPLIALSEALKQIGVHNKQIKLCDKLETLLKSTNKNKVTSEVMKSAMKIIDNHKLIFNL